MKKRYIVALYLNRLIRSEKVSRAKAIHSAVEGSTFFVASPEKTALLLAMESKTDNLAAADAATKGGSHESYALARTAELQYDTAMRNLGYYVQSTADASSLISEDIILSADMKMKKSSVKMQPPIPIEGMRAVITGLGDSVKLLITSSNPRSTHFEVLMTSTPDIPDSWLSVADTTARRLLVDSLTNGTRYYFKARAINNIGRSMYSDVISQLAA